MSNIVENKLNDKAREVYDIVKNDLACFYDSSGSIGRRYARVDEIGIPLCITIDFESLKDDSVTIRDRDTTKQERVNVSEIKKKIYDHIFS